MRGSVAGKLARWSRATGAGRRGRSGTLARWWLHPMFGSHRPFVTYFIALPLNRLVRRSRADAAHTAAGGLAARSSSWSRRRLSRCTMHSIYGRGALRRPGSCDGSRHGSPSADRRSAPSQPSGQRAVVEGAFDCIITMDHEGRITAFNPARAHVRLPAGCRHCRRMAEVIIPPRYASGNHRPWRTTAPRRGPYWPATRAYRIAGRW